MTTNLDQVAAARECPDCGGQGLIGDYVGLEMRCIGVECDLCKGTGRLPAPTVEPALKEGEKTATCSKCGNSSFYGSVSDKWFHSSAAIEMDHEVVREPAKVEAGDGLPPTEEERLEFAKKAVLTAHVNYPYETRPGIPHSGLGNIETYSGMVADYALREIRASLLRERELRELLGDLLDGYRHELSVSDKELIKAAVKGE